MIVRPYQHWFLRLFVWHGSALADILLRLSLNLIMPAIAVIYYHWYEGIGLHLTTAPFSLLGIAIAIFLGFRNNASYARYTEARQLWGALLITQRSLLRQVKGVLNDEQQIYQFSRLLMACLSSAVSKRPISFRCYPALSLTMLTFLTAGDSF